MTVDYMENEQGTYDVYVENRYSTTFIRVGLTEKQAEYLVKKIKELIERPAKNLAWGNL